MRLESWMWANAVPAIVTVMMLPVHGFTSGNTSSNGNAVGGSAAAGAATTRASPASRTEKSVFIAIPPLPPKWCLTATEHGIERQELQPAVQSRRLRAEATT